VINKKFACTALQKKPASYVELSIEELNAIFPDTEQLPVQYDKAA
jgi:hypothetical protein